MTKKKVEVNEDILKNIIVGDIPVFGRAQPMNENTEQPGQESVPVKNAEPTPVTEPTETQSEKTPPVKPMNENTEQPGQESVPVKNTEPVEIQSEKTPPVKPRKKKDEAGSYRDKYLVNIPASNRSHVYINREVAECIKRILPVIAPDMSISGYISNILVDHIQQHWEEISELYNKEYYKPLKPF